MACTRPPLIELDRHLEHAICDLVAEGLALVTAAAALDVPARTAYRWEALGRAGRAPIYVRFYAGLQDARVERRDAINEAIALARQRAHRSR